MASSEPEGKPAATPLDAERGRLRRAGYTDSEISQILIAREAAGNSTESTGHGVMTGVASNLAAAGSYVKNFIPGMVANITTIRDLQARKTARGEAALAFAFKIAVVAVIAYVLAQEFSQLRSLTSRAAADACNARQQLLLNTMPVDQDSGNPRYEAWLHMHHEFDEDCAGYNE